MLFEEPMQAIIWHCLDNYDHKNAVFLAERLCCEIETDETVFTLANSYYRAERTQQAYWLLKKYKSQVPECRFLQAKCAEKLKKYSEAEFALTKVGFERMRNFEDISRDYGEISCFVLQLIARICKKTERKMLAITALKKALKLNPFLWEAFVDLCEMDENVNPAEFFKIHNPNNIESPRHIQDNSPLGFINNTPFYKPFKYCAHISPLLSPSFGLRPLSSSPSTPSPLRNNSSSGNTCSVRNPLGDGKTTLNSNSFQETVTSSPVQQTLAEVNQDQRGLVQRLKTQVFNSLLSNFSKPTVLNQLDSMNTNLTSTPLNTPPPLAMTPVRNSARKENAKTLHLTTNKNVQSRSPNRFANKAIQPPSPTKRPRPKIVRINENNEIISQKPPSSPKKVERPVQRERPRTRNRSESLLQNKEEMKVVGKVSVERLILLFKDLGEAFKKLTRYQCKEAIKILETRIPELHLKTSYPQTLLALALYQLREYESSVLIFKEIHEKDPYRIDSMEIYSSALWQLQKGVELATLAQDMIDLDTSSPITWCVAGNSFSLHQEHETAIKYFRKAVQIDPEFVYSYTLLGHELVLSEEYDLALECFRTAVSRDPRHYSAWYGMGTVYSKQEKHDLAEIHYLRAIKITPLNSVVLVHIGVAQFYLQKWQQALETLTTAIILDPQNPLARFQRCCVRFFLRQYDLALRELEELKMVIPKESAIFYLIGKVHQVLGNTDLALMHFSWASDLDPNGTNNQLKDIFDSMLPTTNCSKVSQIFTMFGDIPFNADQNDESSHLQTNRITNQNSSNDSRLT